MLTLPFSNCVAEPLTEPLVTLFGRRGIQASSHDDEEDNGEDDDIMRVGLEF